MPLLALSVTFLDGTYHGRSDRGEPEWPPSPLRLYQALVATAARCWGTPFPEEAARALAWLAGLPSPTIVAPSRRVGSPYRSSVPNNAMDIVGAAWARGNETGKDAQPATHRAMKSNRTTYVDGESRVYFLWRLDGPAAAEASQELAVLLDLAPQLVAIGWGTNLVAGHGAVLQEREADQLGGERWNPSGVETNALRVPNPQTLGFLTERHRHFLRRLGRAGLTPVPPLSSAAYGRVGYQRDFEAPSRPVAAFQLLKLNADGFRSFPFLHACSVAGMLRHAAAQAAERSGWSEDRVNSFILGHGEPRGNGRHVPVGAARFAYLPLPSLERRAPSGPANVVGSIRRVLMSVPPSGHQADIDWARRFLSGCELIDERSGQPQALISLIPDSDRAVRRYTRTSAVWASVTPVVLPGWDDRKTSKAEQLFRKAIVQAGYSATLANFAAIELRKVSFWPRGDLASRCFVPEHLRDYPRYHCRITWRDSLCQPVAIPGPIAIGGGRYAGLGLMASQADDDS